MSGSLLLARCTGPLTPPASTPTSSPAVTGRTPTVAGQVGPAPGDTVTVVVPSLTERTSLIGETRPIDW
jgi:hypothetical protein